MSEAARRAYLPNFVFSNSCELRSLSLNHVVTQDGCCHHHGAQRHKHCHTHSCYPFFFKWNIQPASRRRLLIFLLSCNLFTIAVIPEILFTSLILILQTAENSFFYQWTIFYLIGEQSFLPYSTNPCFKEPVSWTFSLPQIYLFAKHFSVLTMQR